MCNSHVHNTIRVYYYNHYKYFIQCAACGSESRVESYVGYICIICALQTNSGLYAYIMYYIYLHIRQNYSTI